MRKETLTMENMMNLYHQVVEYVWVIADQILEKTCKHDDWKKQEWNFYMGDIEVTYERSTSSCSCCGEQDYARFYFPAQLLLGDEDAIKTYLETLEKKD